MIVLERFHLDEKLQSITTDNATNMAKMVVQAMLGPGDLNDQPPENENLYPNDDEDEEDTEPKVTKLTTLKKLRLGIIEIRCNGLIYFFWSFLLKL